MAHLFQLCELQQLAAMRSNVQKSIHDPIPSAETLHSSVSLRRMLLDALLGDLILPQRTYTSILLLQNHLI